MTKERVNWTICDMDAKCKILQHEYQLLAGAAEQYASQTHRAYSEGRSSGIAFVCSVLGIVIDGVNVDYKKIQN